MEARGALSSLARDLFLYREVRSSFLADQDAEELVLFSLNCRKLSSGFHDEAENLCVVEVWWALSSFARTEVSSIFSE